jgi:hypothetical protein
MYLLNLVGVATALFGTIQAFQSVNINQNVTAGHNTTVTIVNDDNDASAVNYTVALYTAVQNFPICNSTPSISLVILQTQKLTFFLIGTLITSLPISTTNFSISIPPSVGPSGFYYRVDLISFSSTGTPIFPAPTYTDLFFLSAGTGVLSSYEIPGPDTLIGDTFYSSSALPCSAYDCARQCARADPPTYDENGGLNGDGGIVYDSRYISCLEACPGVDNPITPDTFASTTTGTGSLPTVTPVVSQVNETCSVQEGLTPCGARCCGQGQACWHWGSCEEVDEDGGSTSMSTAATKTSASSTARSTADSTNTAPAASTTTAKSDAGRLQTSLLVAGIGGLVGFYWQA